MRDIKDKTNVASIDDETRKYTSSEFNDWNDELRNIKNPNDAFDPNDSMQMVRGIEDRIGAMFESYGDITYTIDAQRFYAYNLKLKRITLEKHERNKFTSNPNPMTKIRKGFTFLGRLNYTESKLPSHHTGNLFREGIRLKVEGLEYKKVRWAHDTHHTNNTLPNLKAGDDFLFLARYNGSVAEGGDDQYTCYLLLTHNVGATKDWVNYTADQKIENRPKSAKVAPIIQITEFYDIEQKWDKSPRTFSGASSNISGTDKEISLLKGHMYVLNIAYSLERYERMTIKRDKNFSKIFITCLLMQTKNLTNKAEYDNETGWWKLTKQQAIYWKNLKENNQKLSDIYDPNAFENLSEKTFSVGNSIHGRPYLNIDFQFYINLTTLSHDLTFIPLFQLDNLNNFTDDSNRIFYQILACTTIKTTRLSL